VETTPLPKMLPSFIHCLAVVKPGMSTSETGLGRPKGSKSKKKKLSGRESEINELINKHLSKSAIARTLGVHRITIVKFLEKMKNNKSTILIC